jgi:hypothetical protein
MTKPIRIQLSCKKGWKMPPNTVRVDRTTRWGNPWTVGTDGDAAVCASLYRHRVETNKWSFPTVKDVRDELRGKNLACWCKLSDCCHADVLLELANK